MSEPFLAEVRLFSFGFPPKGWAQCDGSILPIEQYQALYSLLGTTFGGDGRTTFQLPDLRGRVPIHKSSSYSAGTNGGEESHVLTTAEIPSHTHTIQAVNLPTGISPTNSSTGNLWATSAQSHYHTYNASSSTSMASDILASSSGGQGRDVMQPFLAVNYCIAITGLFPPRN